MRWIRVFIPFPLSFLERAVAEFENDEWEVRFIVFSGYQVKQGAIVQQNRPPQAEIMYLVGAYKEVPDGMQARDALPKFTFCEVKVRNEKDSRG